MRIQWPPAARSAERSFGRHLIDPLVLVFSTIGLLIAAFVKGAIGLGFPILAVPILAAFFEPKLAVAVVMIPNTLGSGILLARGGMSWSKTLAFWPLFALGIVGAPIGTELVKVLPANAQMILLGVGVEAFVLTQTRSVRGELSPRLARVLLVPVGLFAGMLQAVTGSSSPVLAPYLLNIGLAKRAFVFLISVTFSVQNLAVIFSFLAAGFYTQHVQIGTLGLPVVLWGAMASIPMAAGLWLGAIWQDRLHPHTFRRIILGFLSINGVYLILRGVGVIHGS